MNRRTVLKAIGAGAAALGLDGLFGHEAKAAESQGGYDLFFGWHDPQSPDGEHYWSIPANMGMEEKERLVVDRILDRPEDFQRGDEFIAPRLSKPWHTGSWSFDIADDFVILTLRNIIFGDSPLADKRRTPDFVRFHDVTLELTSDQRFRIQHVQVCDPKERIIVPVSRLLLPRNGAFAPDSAKPVSDFWTCMKYTGLVQL